MRHLLLITSSAFASIFPSFAYSWTFGNASSTATSYSMSGNGRYVAFASEASNFVANDTNGVSDVFRLDTQTGEVIRVSVDSSGSQANGASDSPAINNDGNRIAFVSNANNLVTGDTNGVLDIFLRDVTAGTTVRVSVSSAGIQSNNSSYTTPAISADGTRVAFYSAASNLVSGDSNGYADIFVRDLATTTTVRASVSTGGTQANNPSFAPSISGDGIRVAFYSNSTVLVSGKTTGYFDVFIRDLSASTTIRASVSSSGAEGDNSSTNPSLNYDGTRVAFESAASNLVTGDTGFLTDVFVRDTSLTSTTRVSLNTTGTQANSNSYRPSMSGDGNRVAFYSDATNLVSADTNAVGDIFVRDLAAATTTRISTDSSGNQANGSSDVPSIAKDGTRVAFQSTATNLVAGDNNSLTDVFVADLSSGAMTVPVRLSRVEIE